MTGGDSGVHRSAKRRLEPSGPDSGAGECLTNGGRRDLDDGLVVEAAEGMNPDAGDRDSTVHGASPGANAQPIT